MAVTQKTAENFSIDQGADLSKEFTVTTDGSDTIHTFTSSGTFTA